MESQLNSFAFAGKQSNQQPKKSSNLKTQKSRVNKLSELKSRGYKLISFPHPVDINWIHIGSSETKKNIKIILLNVTMILILLFLSTPTALLDTLKQSKTVGNVLEGGFSSDWPPMIHYILLQFLPPLITILINNILLILIFYLCIF